MSPRILLSLALALGASSALGKPLYVTVPRTFSTAEAPTLDVAFEVREPVELRILAPKDTEAFLVGQQTLRRAYERPPTLVNPGRALARGLNGLRSPVEALRFAFGPAARGVLSPALADFQPLNSSSTLEERPRKLVGIPDSMTLVKSRWLNLDLGGAERDSSVPGFEAWGQSAYQERTVSLEPLPAGVYVVQLVQGTIEGQVVLVVSDLTAQVKQTDGEVLVRVAGRDQQPRAKAQVRVLVPGQRPLTGETDAAGEVRLRTSEPRLLVTVGQGRDLAVVDTDFYSTLAVAPDVFLYTDRPLYRPGDTARFRGVLRQPDTFLSRLLRPRRSQVEVSLLSEGVTARTTVAVDAFGCFSGKLAVPAGLPTGVLRVQAKVDSAEHQAEARVQEYVKPTFYLELKSAEETIQPGGQVKAQVTARRYAGGAPKKAVFHAYLYRTLLDSPAWVDDSGLGGQGSAVTYGTVSTTEGALSVPQKLASTVPDDGSEVWSAALPFDESGAASVTLPVPALQPGDEKKPWRYTLSVRAKDDQDTFATAGQTYFLAESDLLAGVTPRQRVVRPGEAARFAVRATTLSRKPYGATAGEVRFTLRTADGKSQDLGTQAFQTDEAGVARLEARSAAAGTLEASVTVKDRKGLTWTGTASSLVLGPGGEAVTTVPTLTLEALGGALQPGDTAEVVVLLPPGWGPGESTQGSLWVTLTGNGLYATERVAVKGLTHVHRFPVERRFGSAVYASVAYPSASGRWEERTVPFRIVPRERTLSVQVTPQKKEASPLTEQTVSLRVTDASGRPVAAQVSLSVVDKAVYALQAEFRPGIVDFFYPVGRDNVSTFTSAQFQAYGYGERLALKLARLPGHAFAAVKPPSKVRQEDDTVYWNPAIATDRDGRATVTFRLNSMQTLWTATAVAVDASGRFGEATAEFASRGALLVAANLPQFLRQGDVATGSVRVSVGKGKDGPVSVGWTVGGAAAAVQETKEAALKAGDEVVYPVALRAAEAGEVQVRLEASGPGEPLADVRRLQVQPATLEDTVVVSQAGGGALKLELPPGATVVSSRLTLMPGLLDVALAQARELLVYPHGCVEQLVSTTVPNVALYRTLEQLKAVDQLDPESRGLLAEARSRAVQGTAQLLDMAVKGGGFGWFSGQSSPSLEMTLIAVDGLSFVAEAGLLDRGEPRLAEAAAWLDAQQGLSPLLEATRRYALARLQGNRQAAKVRAFLDAPGSEDPAVLALGVLAADAAGLGGEKGVQEKVAALAERAREAVAQPAVFRPSADTFRYPLGEVGTTAIVARAASRSAQVDVERTRARVLALLTRPGLSTFDRSTALLHSQWLIERDVKALKRLAPPSVEGAQVDFSASGSGLAAQVDARATALTVGAFDGVAQWRATVRVPFASVTATERGMSLKRAYHVLRGGQRQPLSAGEPVKPGDDVYVELTLDTRPDEARRDARSAYSVLEDGVPAGFSVLQEDKAYRGAPYNLPLAHEALKRRSFTPERITFYLEEPAAWSARPRVVGYVLRAGFPGTFVAPPAQLEDMYAASLGARTGPDSLTVAP